MEKEEIIIEVGPDPYQKGHSLTLFFKGKHIWVGELDEYEVERIGSIAFKRNPIKFFKVPKEELLKLLIDRDKGSTTLKDYTTGT